MSENLTLRLLLCALFLTAVAPSARGAGPERPPRVLMVHSFGTSAPPFTTHSTAFESAIAKELGTAVDLDHVSLDMARYAQPDMEEAFVEFLTKRFTKWQPDLVVPIGSPAGRFVAKYRDRLFPQMPVVYTGMDRRTLPADAFARNATFVGEEFDLKGLVEDMLQLVPETNHVVVILGATPLERYWTAQFQEAFKPFEGRVKFTWVNDLSFEQMLDLVSKLPPRSFVLLGLLLRDASGVTHNEDLALARLHAVSRAPINGLFLHEVGLGIVGGRLYQGELEGVEGARVAARILRGEPASSFPPLLIGTSTPTYDWRELRRWGISESRLPPGSVVLFRQPTAWQRYRWHVLGATVVIVTQAVLIFLMFFQLRRRRIAEVGLRHAEAEAHQKREELAHLSRVAVVGELTASLAHEINQPLTAILSNSVAGKQFLDAPAPDLQEVRETLADIEEDTTRAADIIRRLRDMLRRDTPGFGIVDLNQVIRSIERIVRSDAVQHGVTLRLELAADGVPVKGDSVQLQQVMLNLTLNAFAAMTEPASDRERRLIVRTKSTDESNALIEVQDSGTGVPPGTLETIFDRFVTSKRDGLGMGLSICRSIIERHGGRIWAANNPDRGATFSITLPVHIHQAESGAPTEATGRMDAPAAADARNRPLRPIAQSPSSR
jgi:signal transduction histidine kinase